MEPWPSRCSRQQCLSASVQDGLCKACHMASNMDAKDAKVLPAGDTPSTGMASAAKKAAVVAAGVAGAAGLTKLYQTIRSGESTVSANALLGVRPKPRRLSLEEWLALTPEERRTQPVPPYGLPLADGSAWHLLTLTDGSSYGFIPQWQAFYCGKSRPGKLVPHGDGTLWTQQLDDGKMYVTYAHFTHGKLPTRAHLTWSCRPKEAWKQEPPGTMPPITVVPPSVNSASAPHNQADMLAWAAPESTASTPVTRSRTKPVVAAPAHVDAPWRPGLGV